MNTTAEFLAAQGFNATIIQRFWKKVEKTGTCWLWTGCLTGPGNFKYGQIGCGGRHGKRIKAHRLSWILHYGPIPYGIDILHKCDNPPCVRPVHLFEGTHAINSTDMAQKDRSPYGEGHPRHKLTEDAVRAIRRDYATGAFSMADLGKAYGVTTNGIFYVLRHGWIRTTEQL